LLLRGLTCPVPLLEHTKIRRRVNTSTQHITMQLLFPAFFLLGLFPFGLALDAPSFDCDDGHGGKPVCCFEDEAKNPDSCTIGKFALADTAQRDLLILSPILI
jgi:hypothetical protein